ncbi:unnamed protein product [Acanthosepion pharaonis]|uniref:Uncharacterized protein n=1 Tax=Acanthosepion pharaonis TaxID=158019 RepID=A0A812EK60_ACAPH|nr:unnamed protein product [Sepia pharaonis]
MHLSIPFLFLSFLFSLNLPAHPFFITHSLSRFYLSLSPSLSLSFFLSFFLSFLFLFFHFSFFFFSLLYSYPKSSLPNSLSLSSIFSLLSLLFLSFFLSFPFSFFLSLPYSLYFPPHHFLFLSFTPPLFFFLFPLFILFSFLSLLLLLLLSLFRTYSPVALKTNSSLSVTSVFSLTHPVDIQIHFSPQLFHNGLFFLTAFPKQNSTAHPPLKSKRRRRKWNQDATRTNGKGCQSTITLKKGGKSTYLFCSTIRKIFAFLFFNSLPLSLPLSLSLSLSLSLARVCV